MNGEHGFQRPFRQQNGEWIRAGARLETGKPAGRLLEQEVWVTYKHSPGCERRGEFRGRFEREN